MATFRKIFIFLLSVVKMQCAIRKIDLGSINNVVWILSNNKIQVLGRVPGGVYSDLQRAGIIDDILSGFNDLRTRWVAYDMWTYTGNFTVDKKAFRFSMMNLIFEGVDTVGFIELNGLPIGTTNNMFVRYVFDVKKKLKIGVNELKVTFTSPVEAAHNRSREHFTPPACVLDSYKGECHANQLRKMQASFSWDWGPAFPSVGLWKPVFIELYDGAIIRSVATHMKKIDEYWDLKIVAYVETGIKKRLEGYLSATLEVEGSKSVKIGSLVEVVTRKDGTGQVELKMNVPFNLVRLWWPNGFGDQPLYDLTVSLTTHEDGDRVSFKRLKIGFRTLELVEEDASNKLGNTTAGYGLTFYFKVNGYPIFMKGSNWIPTNILPELGYEKATVDGLLLSVKETHMSMLRVWEGGVYESDYFYERCDQLGILIWQDFLFTCAMYPVDQEFLDNVKNEIEQTVIRLQHHASIALWAGNNENEGALRENWYNTEGKFSKYRDEYVKLYVHTIQPIVERLDPERRYIVSSPSNGLQSIKEGHIATNPYHSNYGDTHNYDYFFDHWDYNTYLNTRFASECGFQSMPSIKTMATANKNKEDYRINSRYSKHRQHSANGYGHIHHQIIRRLNLSDSDPRFFEKFVFYSQISQAMGLKIEMEFYRQSQENWYTMGALYWQLNDVWQTPSWSSIEYGGKWKMLHYFAKLFFAPVLVSPRLLLDDVVDLYVINDRFDPIVDAKIIVQYYNWNSLVPFETKEFSANVELLSAKKQMSLDLGSYDTYKVFFQFSLEIEGESYSPINFIFPKPLKYIKGLREPNIKVTITKMYRHWNQDWTLKYTYNINIEVDTVVLFLWLDTDLSDGRFIDNGLLITRPNTVIEYLTHKRISSEELQKSITYQYYTN